ncbi:mRNA surveillance protein pelota [Candidatus Woesearchaeota archaeon]|nr:mRNA surveillance protein pelota [Candidatus Woesearchaeota archaeon]
MKVVSFHKNVASLRIESLDDLWYLSSLLEAGDLVEGKTMRKIKLGGGEERSTSVVKKPVYLKIEVEKVEFHKFSNNLRVAGRILEGTEDIPKGSYHTFAIEDDSQIKLQKGEWLSFHKERLREASKERRPPLLICVFDRDEALIAIMKQYGYDLLAHLHGAVQKKRDVTQVTSNFYEEIENAIKEYIDRFHVRSVLMASPGFWKDEFLKNLKDDALKKKIVFATVSSVDKGAINELLGRPEVKSVLQQERFAQEVALVNDLLSAIAKVGLAAYGLKETAAAAEACAVKRLLITDGFLQKKREQDAFEPIQTLLHTVDKGKGEIHIISSDHDGGKKLDGLGGIAALLRFAIS